MKTKTIHTIAIAVLFVVAGVNLYSDHRDRKELLTYQVDDLQNTLANQTTSETTLNTLKLALEAIDKNQQAVKSLLPSMSRLQQQVAELLEHTNFVIEERNEEFLKKIRKAKTCDFSINGSPLAPECVPI